ncbi:MAG: hypothetical protein ACJ789_05315 [Thermomicrobiales bacterium]
MSEPDLFGSGSPHVVDVYRNAIRRHPHDDGKRVRRSDWDYGDFRSTLRPPTQTGTAAFAGVVNPLRGAPRTADVQPD